MENQENNNGQLQIELKEENKIKTKAKKKTYITGLHGSGAAKMKAEIRKKRANRHKGK